MRLTIPIFNFISTETLVTLCLHLRANNGKLGRKAYGGDEKTTGSKNERRGKREDKGRKGRVKGEIGRERKK